jgi:hypothetical protein
MRRVRGVAFAACVLAVIVAAPPAFAATVDAVLVGTAGANGWYVSNVTVSFQKSGETSSTGCDTYTLTQDGVDSSHTCTVYGPDGQKTATPTVKIDKTPPATTATPSPGPNANGWNNTPVTVTFTGTDATSGIASCSPPAGYGGPDNGNAVLSGSCRDVAGNVGGSAVTVKYDATAPAASAAPERAPNGNGWYNAALRVTFNGTDATSGVASCSPTATYTGPDSASAAVTGTCRDGAGNVSAAASFAVKYDGTAPTISANPARSADSNGWYNHAIGVAFAGGDAMSGVDNCTSASYGGPDTAGATLTGSCTDKAGNSASARFDLKYDSTAPGITASVERGPDANGWYNRPVGLTVSGSDDLSGLAGCGGSKYQGPTDATASLTGTCRDNAGNSAAKSVAVKYDDAPPKLTDLAVSTGSGTATLSWKASGDTSQISIVRTPDRRGATGVAVYKGTGRSFTDTKLKNGLRYRYAVTGTDEAGNDVTVTAAATPRALTSPLEGSKLRRPPLLVWTAVKGASYYNVQLFRGRKKVLSIWPKITKLQLKRTWTYAGKKYALTPARYRWYVWPGYGPRKNARYKPILGGSFFFVVKG